MTLNIQENTPLAPFTTLQIGGPARYFVEIGSEEALSESLDWAAERRLQVFVLGGGSNLLVADEGFAGLVLRIAITGIEWRNEVDRALATVGAGENWDNFVGLCVERDLAGVECLSGIPGSVGGTPVQNVGAYGQEVSETIVVVRAFDRLIGRFVELSNEDCRFSYRSGVFNTTARDRYIVTAVTFALRPRGEPALRYPDLKNYFAGTPAAPTLLQVREATLAIRARKAMVLDPHDPDSRSAGSFFKNPIVAPEKIRQIEEVSLQRGLRREAEMVPKFPAVDGMIKVPAAWLIERAGFQKGYRLGRVGLSSKHTLAIINRGGATARETLDLVALIQNKVREVFGVELQPEPVLVGFDRS